MVNGIILNVVPQDGYNEPVNKDISAKDLCENTGYKYDKDINYCYKDILGTNKKTDTTTYGEYCSNKTLKDTNDIVNWSTHNLSPEEDYKRPCSVCQFFEVSEEGTSTTKNYCKALERKECSKLTETQCGSNRPGTSLSTANSLIIFYRHNMKPEAITINNESVQVRHSEFNCQQEAQSGQSVCSRHDTRENVNQQVRITRCQQVVNGNVHIF